MAVSQLTILYTANLAGRLDWLPRLFTLITRARSEVRNAVALIDLGGSCAPTSWECAATQGRAALLIFDAMGYNAACLAEHLTDATAQKLCETVGMAVCAPEDRPVLPAVVAWESGPWQIALQAGTTAPPTAVDLTVKVGNSLRLDSEERALWLALPPGDVVAMAEVTFDDATRSPQAVEFRQQALSEDTRRDPTIAAVIDFVRHEAHRYQQIRQ